MRSATLLGLVGLPATLLACDGTRITGTDITPLSLRAAPAGAPVPLIFLDGRRLPPGTSLDYLRTQNIAMVEVVKGAAAARLYGEDGRYGVIHITTKSASGPPR
jgi:outer membrane receptor for ferrienterochelin and colicin